MTLFDIRQIAKRKIEEKNLDPSVINILLEEVLGLSYQNILIQNIQNLEPHIETRFFSLLDKYLENKLPLQYILGYTYFYKRKFKVNKNVLIPRFETEELVYHALKIIDKYNYKDIVDIGSGSGNISISLKKENEALNVLGLDISLDALEVSKENAKILNAEVKYEKSDLLSYLIENNIKVDFIVSNPPYIDYQDEEVDEIVKNNEPHLALYALDNGLYNYKNIIDNAFKVLNKNGALLFEIGYKQGALLKEYININHPSYQVKIISDIDKKDRMLFIKINE